MQFLETFALLALVAAPPTSPAPSHCRTGERPVFTCSVGKKTVSVCATAALSSTEGALLYRFGASKRLEIDDAPAPKWRDATRGGHWMFSGGGGAWLAFDRPPYRYVVYTAVGRGWGEKSGVAVEKDGQRVANLPCQKPPLSELGPALFTQAGIVDQDAGFELP